MLNWHWRRRHAFKAEVYAWLVAAFSRDLMTYQVRGPAKRKVTVYEYRHQKLDVDNLVGSVKYLLDQLQELNLIYNDTADYLELEVYQEVDRKNQRTELLLEEEDG